MLARVAAVLCFGLALMHLPARAADPVLVGSVDAASANLWPLYIGQQNGYFDAADLKLDVIFSQSNASSIQQLAAGSLNISPSAGLVDPIRAIEKGAPISIVRILLQAPPYALLAKPAIRRWLISRAKPSSSAGRKTSRASSSSACWQPTA